MALKNTWTTGESFTATAANDVATEILGINASGVYASRPTVGHPGRLYFCTDNGNVYKDNGTTWDLAALGGSGLAGVEPPSASWSTTTLGSATVAADKGGRLFTVVSAAGVNVRVEYRTLSPTSNYTATFYLGCTFPLTNQVLGGIFLRNSSSGSLIHFGPSYDTGTATSPYMQASQWTNATTFSANYQVTSIPTVYFINWWRIRDDGTNRYFEYSYDGFEWQTFFSGGRTNFITPDQIGWGAFNNSGITAYQRLRSFSVV